MIRYKKLGYIALNVSDIERSTQFYRDMVGLHHESGDQPKLQDVTDMAKGPTVDSSESRKSDDPVFFRYDRQHHQIALYPSKEPGLKRVGMELESEEQLEIAFEILTKAGVNPQEVDK